MLTAGIDVASQAANTACCWVRWTDDRANILHIEQPIEDERLRLILNDESADKIGIDVPLGWPTAFVKGVTAHHAGNPWPLVESRQLVRRATDWWVYEEIRQLPLSVSTDRIAYPAMRIAALLPDGVDRRGEGRIVEVYPAAALRQWRLPFQRYKKSLGAAGLDQALRTLRERTASWLHASEDIWSRVRNNDDCFDALVAALVARAKAVGLCVPLPMAEVDEAKTEGWIALPMPGSLENLLSTR